MPVSTHQDAVKLCCHEGDPWLVDGLRKALVGQLQAAPREGVCADVATQGAGAVLNGELGAVGLGSRLEVGEELAGTHTEVGDLPSALT